MAGGVVVTDVSLRVAALTALKPAWVADFKVSRSSRSWARFSRSSSTSEAPPILASLRILKHDLDTTLHQDPRNQASRGPEKQRENTPDLQCS